MSERERSSGATRVGKVFAAVLLLISLSVLKVNLSARFVKLRKKEREKKF